MQKRGLSAVVTSLILILLVFVAVGIVWVVVRNVLDEGADDITLNSVTLDLEILDVNIQRGTAIVNVKRNPGEGEFNGINFVVSDGQNTQVIPYPTSIDELGSATIELPINNMVVKEISIFPTYTSDTGKPKIGNVKDTFVFKEDQIIKNSGAVAWWKLDGNARDEITKGFADNNGVEFVSDFDRGKVGKFDGDKWLQMDLNFPTEGTMMTWIQGSLVDQDPIPNIYPFGWIRIFAARGPIHGDEGSGVMTGNGVNAILPAYDFGDQQFYDNAWHQYVITWNSSHISLYKNGKIIESPQSASILVQSGSFGIGSAWGEDGAHNGRIDDVIVFNRVLSDQEIRALYELQN